VDLFQFLPICKTVTLYHACSKPEYLHTTVFDILFNWHSFLELLSLMLLLITGGGFSTGLMNFLFPTNSEMNYNTKIAS